MRRPQQQGFTLVELIIAVGIMALLGTVGAMLLNTSLVNQSAIEARQQALERVSLALTIFRRDIEQLTPRIPRDEQGDAMAANIVAEQVGANSELEFVHGGRRVLPGQSLGSTLERVRYVREESELIRYSAAVADPASNTGWRRQVLLTNVTEFVVELYDGERWSVFWPPSTQVTETQPESLRMTMSTEIWPDIQLNVLLPEQSL
ncbi:Type II secretion system protein J [Zhongshania aliphaticivorans]|uniref:Type II secretion system protein J n=1 Tax=Zhongshania aliphaticivorans TaxID=1470434 RepID=A0A5S9Q9N2_9GAMM|nr:type II secretion system minor pseudopilin GspJ [Zhongshania aliphaticivorans]CAA0087235.1 Type II secretion system protein J [Zhongshania aliphaticivorans]CAA0114358.1 Type II secretion system protein J [Zhongshania aliphaticivorans]